MNETAGIDDDKFSVPYGASMFVSRGGENLADDVGIDQVFCAIEIYEKNAVILNWAQWSVLQLWGGSGLQVRRSYGIFLHTFNCKNDPSCRAKAITKGFKPGLIVHYFERNDVSGFKFE